MEIPPSPTDSKIWSSTNIADKYYLIGLGGRGIIALQEYGVWNDVKDVGIEVPGRKDWTTKTKAKAAGDDSEPYVDDGIEKMLTDRKYLTHVLPRDKLVSVLYKHIQDNYADRITIHYGYDLQPLHFDYYGEDDDDDAEEDESSSSSVLVRVVNPPKTPPDGDGGDDYIISTKFLVVADGCWTWSTPTYRPHLP